MNIELKRNKYKTKSIGKRSAYKQSDIVQDIIMCKITKHYTNHDIIKHLKEKYGYCDSWCYTYLNAAADKITEIQNQNIQTALQEQQLKILNEIREMKEKGENQMTILAWIKEYNKITGLHQERVQLTGEMKIVADFGFEKNDTNDPDTSSTIPSSYDTEENP